ncbi:energy-coupling factor transporter ATPase [Pediococcus claussenii]|uniref:Energy-coupling factor transporter ATP-binding protein EcfA1 n=1 Tax=Pediococcus claussenii (strain ATCC BAA-344 / DSM 14800 / JCM 18046 / KCTC 3811 / LMG 21948 / P06) TaxID=701521 RepID=G8PE26_PEDCP|nr:energy-coupling factor transporter ATPase [Pediococcus claussenii]AEV95511.1 Energy-coupling factor transporter ATP-binding protein EcfA1 [Pediococcus claussenii ATCC BAA-344]ANZ69034.1 energy-coupling factor transporter ATPase [Pediococcus claussenii]ANZ70850.1 energy-coupling factor transporter ATPase [Pediococcus claussenii]KRN20254.1 ecfA1 protein [Pediococcus claussenii]
MTDNIIEVKNLTYKYSDEDENPALNNVSLKVRRGSWTAIVGHNGSGKSTLARSIDGLMEFKQGEINVDGIVLSDTTVWEVRNRIGMIFQNPDNQFVGATVEDDVAFGLENKGVDHEQMHNIVNNVLERVGMGDFKARQPDQLSGGQKQRVAIAGVLAINPKVIILDEATSMLDPEGRQDILQLVRDIKKNSDVTVISITHDIDEAMLADDVIVLNNGNFLRQGKPTEVFKDDKLIKQTGLELPFTSELWHMLKTHDISLKSEAEFDTVEMGEELWQLISEK